MKGPVVISNGYGRFHLRLAAAEAARRGRLAAYITAAYPTARLSAFARARFAHLRPIARLLSREDNVPADRVHAQWAAEPFHHLDNAARRLPGIGNNLGEALQLAGRALYTCGAAHVIAALPEVAGRGVYHYRAGFGLGSLAVARRRGWVLLCDHSIAHPAVLDHLVASGGKLPAPGVRGAMTPTWRQVEQDIDAADHVLVNSGFVADTFAHLGWDRARLDVIWLGIDAGFLEAIPARGATGEGPLALLFAGAFGRRKGADALMAALATLDDVDWRLDVCGPIEPYLAGAAAQLRDDRRVTFHGIVPAADLARHMAAADVFVFPSLAEGSARVVFEALAAGCYVVTTKNAGSIVADGVHGAIVPPADPAALAAALREAAADRGRLVAVGRGNAALVRRHYHQGIYGDRLAALYDRLIDERHDDL